MVKLLTANHTILKTPTFMTVNNSESKKTNLTFQGNLNDFHNLELYAL